jgi:uncharacterized protein YaaR (DUF327 family)
LGVKIGPKSGMIRTDVELKESTKLKVSNTDFLDLLKRDSGKNTQQELEKLLQEIDSLGAALAEDLSLKTLKRYREAIKQFISYAIKGSIEVLDQSGIDIYGSPRSYKIIRKVDDSLEQLAQAILKRHEAQIEIVARVSEIRGLLVDLMG